MTISYKKLWKLLIDRDIKKKDLCEMAGVSHASLAKLGRCENITTDILLRICSALCPCVTPRTYTTGWPG